MKFLFNPLNSQFEIKNSLTLKKVIKSFLLESKTDQEFSKVNILFDEDSILFNDDDENL